MIMQPEAAGPDLWPVALEQAARRGTPFLERLHFERVHEGRSAQIMHIGPYSTEPATVDRLHGFIRAARVCGRAAGTTRSIWATRAAAPQRS